MAFCYSVSAHSPFSAAVENTQAVLLAAQHLESVSTAAPLADQAEEAGRLGLRGPRKELWLKALPCSRRTGPTQESRRSFLGTRLSVAWPGRLCRPGAGTGPGSFAERQAGRRRAHTWPPLLKTERFSGKLHCPVWQPLTTQGHGTLKMWLVRPRNCIFHFIFFFFILIQRKQIHAASAAVLDGSILQGLAGMG